MNKAYDWIEWNFLHDVLRANGFCEQFCQLIMSCVTSVSYSVLLNGDPLKNFTLDRGLRQRDPLSPYLFILCSEVLSKEEDRGFLHGIKVARQAPTISHLMFVDDTMLFR